MANSYPQYPPQQGSWSAPGQPAEPPQQPYAAPYAPYPPPPTQSQTGQTPVNVPVAPHPNPGAGGYGHHPPSNISGQHGYPPPNQYGSQPANVNNPNPYDSVPGCATGAYGAPASTTPVHVGRTPAPYYPDQQAAYLRPPPPPPPGTGGSPYNYAPQSSQPTGAYGAYQPPHPQQNYSQSGGQQGLQPPPPPGYPQETQHPNVQDHYAHGAPTGQVPDVQIIRPTPPESAPPQLESSPGPPQEPTWPVNCKVQTAIELAMRVEPIPVQGKPPPPTVEGQVRRLVCFVLLQQTAFQELIISRFQSNPVINDTRKSIGELNQLLDLATGHTSTVPPPERVINAGAALAENILKAPRGVEDRIQFTVFGPDAPVIPKEDVLQLVEGYARLEVSKSMSAFFTFNELIMGTNPDSLTEFLDEIETEWIDRQEKLRNEASNKAQAVVLDGSPPKGALKDICLHDYELCLETIYAIRLAVANIHQLKDPRSWPETDKFGRKLGRDGWIWEWENRTRKALEELEQFLVWQAESARDERRSQYWATALAHFGPTRGYAVHEREGWIDQEIGKMRQMAASQPTPSAPAPASAPVPPPPGHGAPTSLVPGYSHQGHPGSNPGYPPPSNPPQGYPLGVHPPQSAAPQPPLPGPGLVQHGAPPPSHGYNQHGYNLPPPTQTQFQQPQPHGVNPPRHVVPEEPSAMPGQSYVYPTIPTDTRARDTALKSALAKLNLGPDPMPGHHGPSGPVPARGAPTVGHAPGNFTVHTSGLGRNARQYLETKKSSLEGKIGEALRSKSPVVEALIPNRLAQLREIYTALDTPYSSHKFQTLKGPRSDHHSATAHRHRKRPLLMKDIYKALAIPKDMRLPQFERHRLPVLDERKYEGLIPTYNEIPWLVAYQAALVLELHSIETANTTPLIKRHSAHILPQLVLVHTLIKQAPKPQLGPNRVGEGMFGVVLGDRKLHKKGVFEQRRRR